MYRVVHSMSENPVIIAVAIPVPLDTTFHYLVPPRLVDAVQPGKRVLVPFGRRTVTGYVLDSVPASGETLKEVREVLDEEPLFTPTELEFFRWSASYYLHPLGEVLKAALPAGINIVGRMLEVMGEDGAPVVTEVLSGGRRVRTETFYEAVPAPPEGGTVTGKGDRILASLREGGVASVGQLTRTFGTCYPQLKKLKELGLVTATEREVYRDPFKEQAAGRDEPLQLNPHQAEALRQVEIAIGSSSFSPFLLFGVTGSGKTEVYLQAIDKVLSRDRTALVLVPEISLTPQLVKRFRRRFDCGIAVLHSGLSDGERYDEWRRIRRREAVIVIGARSAVFAPLADIGIIVVDEEHDGSYKQSEGFRYNARDLALVRGKINNACVVLGSATPLVTTWHAAEQGKLVCLTLPQRVRDLPLPVPELVDMRGRKSEILSSPLLDALTGNLTNGRQSLLFLNRRGFATFLVCRDCGHVMHCPNCAVTLTYHRRRGRHFCHYCDHSIPAPSLCPGCDSAEIGLFGHGTERLEEEAASLFPEANIRRMDRDSTTRKGSHAGILQGLEDGSIDILIGTQMIAKGHDFPGVTVVGIISADSSLNLPDFRSAERTFQLVTQVMGRAGRGDEPGTVLIQTLVPEHYAISHAVRHDYEGFCREELTYRRELGYPPFAHLVAFTLSSNSAREAEERSLAAVGLLRTLRRELNVRVEILGPATAPLGKIRGRYRWQILLKGVSRKDLHRLAARFREQFKLSAVVRMAVDIDPVDML